MDGIVRMMTGGSFAHSVIKTNVANGLNAALGDGPCLAVVDELKVVTDTRDHVPGRGGDLLSDRAG